VSFVRDAVPLAENVVPQGLEEYVQPPRRDSAIRVGRISLFYD
jgi:hypothetical protein